MSDNGHFHEGTTLLSISDASHSKPNSVIAERPEGTEPLRNVQSRPTFAPKQNKEVQFPLMPVYEFEGRIPRISPGAYVFPNATVIGDVEIGDKSWIGPGAVLRGDYGAIRIGNFTAIEDNCVIHARPGERTEIGDHVTIGHSSVIHTGSIDEWAVIGMKSVVSDFAKVGRWAAVGEGAVVKSKSEIPDNAIAVGIPAKIIGNVDERYKTLWTEYKLNYNTFADRYRKLKQI